MLSHQDRAGVRTLALALVRTLILALILALTLVSDGHSVKNIEKKTETGFKSG